MFQDKKPKPIFYFPKLLNFVMKLHLAFIFCLDTAFIFHLDTAIIFRLATAIVFRLDTAIIFRLDAAIIFSLDIAIGPTIEPILMLLTLFTQSCVSIRSYVLAPSCTASQATSMRLKPTSIWVYILVLPDGFAIKSEARNCARLFATRQLTA